MHPDSSPDPVRLRGDLDPALSRWKWLVKWALAIPHYLVLVALLPAYLAVTAVAFFAIAATGRYPRRLFEFSVGVMRWRWRVWFYALSALGTDRYPPFSLKSMADYPADLEIDYPQQLHRGLVLVKWWLLALPHYLILGIMFNGGWRFFSRTENSWDLHIMVPLVAVLLLVAMVSLLVTGRYPRGLYDFVLGMNRWSVRVRAYASLMTDAYPPFRLDQGAREPETISATT